MFLARNLPAFRGIVTHPTILARSLRALPSPGCPKDDLRGVAASSPLHRPVARVMTRCEDARNRFTAQLPARCFDLESKPPAAGWFPARCLRPRAPPSPALSSRLPARRIRARSPSAPLPARKLRPRPHPRAVTHAWTRTRSPPHSNLRGRVDRARLLARLPARGFERARRARLSSFRGYPRQDWDVPASARSFRACGFERLETGLAVARAMISSSGHSLVHHLAVARSMTGVRVAERLR
jgi:hypothetical protein